jgi:hypothetical protein
MIFSLIRPSLGCTAGMANSQTLPPLISLPSTATAGPIDPELDFSTWDISHPRSFRPATQAMNN